MTAPARIAYHLVENRGRELASRLLVAKALARRGIPSVICQQLSLQHNLGSLPPGIAILKGVDAVQAETMEILRASGHLPVSIDEESLVIQDAHHMRRQLAPHARPAQVYATSDWHAEVFRERYPDVLATGNPRTDMLAHPEIYAEEATAIRASRPPFVLFNTNNALINTAFADHQGLFDVFDAVVVPQADDEHWIARELERDAKALREVRQLIRRLEGVPIVLRPHPSENAEAWRQHYAGHPTVEIVQDGDHHAWMLAARAVVHTGCTSGLEGHLLGCATVALRTGYPTEAIYRSNDIAPAFGAEDGAASVRRHLSGPATDPASIPPRQQDDQAHERIAAAIASLMGPETASLPAEWRTAALSDYDRGKSVVSLQEFQETGKRLARAFDFSGIRNRVLAEGVFLTLPVS